MSQPPSLAVSPDVLVLSSQASQQWVQLALCTRDGRDCLEPMVGYWKVADNANQTTIPFPTIYEAAIKVSRDTPADQRERYNTFYLQVKFFSSTPSGYHQPRCCSDDMERLPIYDFLGSSKAVRFDPWEASTQKIVLALVQHN